MPVKSRILAVVGPHVTQTCRIAGITQLSRDYRFIDLEIDAERLRDLGPVDKAKINAGAWNMRTYTPLLHAEPGVLRLLIYVHHGDGPGARWAAQVRVGDAVQVGGPKAALQLEAQPSVLLGDETSIGVALNLTRTAQTRSVLEATDAQQMQQVLEALQLHSVTVVPRSPGSAHRAELTEAVALAVRSMHEPSLILTGHAQTIQQVGRELKARNIRPQTHSKPHWADRKEGLD